MKHRISFLQLLMLVTFVFEASGAIRPSFNHNFSVVKATHIVVATEGKTIDGILQILESWKGDLSNGETIIIPELAQFASEESRMIHQWDRKKTRLVTGTRMILFLVKSLELTTGKEDGKAITKVRWLPTSYPEYRPVFAGGTEPRDNFTRMRISVAWVEDGKIYAFCQVFNPGPLVLTNISNETESEMKARVLELVKNSKEFEKVAALPDSVKRADALVLFTEVKGHRARERAFNSLSECGVPALPHLRKMLKDETLADRHYLAVKALAKAGGVHVGPELTTLLEDELVFWKTQAPLLKATKWNDLSAKLRARHGKLEQTIKAVDWIRFAAAKDAVIKIRNYWQSEPRLNRLTGGPGHNTIRFQCDEYLRHASSQLVTNVSSRIIRKVAEELEQLKATYSELSDFSQDCISSDGLSLHYRKNVVDGIKGTVLGKGEACEIVISFSSIVNRGISPIPWGNYTIKYPELNWQVCSYPAAFWTPSKPNENCTARFGGRFIRSHKLELCRIVSRVVLKHLRKLDDLKGRQ